MNLFMKNNDGTSLKKGTFIFTAIIVVIYLYVGLFSVLKLRPVSVHMWAMCDRASVARNYAQDSMNFFLPRVHETREKSGITGMEFPIVNYIAAVFYRIFGFNEIWYRLIMLLLTTSGLIVLFRLTFRLTNSFYVSLFPPLIILASPVFTYYAASFIPDIASLAFLIIGWYYFFNYLKSPRILFLILIGFFFALATLIKLTAAISIVVIFVMLPLIKYWRSDNMAAAGKIKLTAIPLSLSLIITFFWYHYAGWLSEHENGGVFLMQLKTPSSMQEINSLFEEIRKIWLPFYFQEIISWLILITFIVPLFFIRKINKLLFLLTYGNWAGNFAFFFLMMEQFKQHDYYIITLLPAVFFQTLLVIDLIIQSKRIIQRLCFSIGMITLIIGMKFNKEHQAFRYSPDCWLYNWDRFKDYLTIEDYVQSLGINHTSKVISTCDDSPNIALYYLNLKGWTVNPDASANDIKNVLSFSPEYFITNDSSKAALPAYSGLLTPIGKQGTIYFFRIKQNLIHN